MIISDYFAYFHDGSLIDVKHSGSTIILSIESAEISPEENKDKILLSKHSTIKGKLHLEGVKTIKDNDKLFGESLRMLHDNAEILDLSQQNNYIKLGLEWVNFRPFRKVAGYSFYNIEFERLWWENIPDLHNPSW